MRAVASAPGSGLEQARGEEIPVALTRATRNPQPGENSDDESAGHGPTIISKPP
jgi:hypothetical protein